MQSEPQTANISTQQTPTASLNQTGIQFLKIITQIPHKILAKLFNFNGYRLFFDGNQTFPLISFSELLREVARAPKVSHLSNYIISSEGFRVLYLFWDWDHKNFNINNLKNKLQDLEIASLITETKRGYHLYVFLHDQSDEPDREEKNFIADILQINDDDKWIHNKIYTLARVPGSAQGDSHVKILFAQNGKFLKFERKKIKTQPQNNYKATLPLCPGVLKDMLSPNPSHYGRFAFVAWLAQQGKSAEEIFKIFKKFRPIDFSEHTTKYQINHIISKNYRPPSCSTLRALGFCIDNCIFRKWRR